MDEGVEEQGEVGIGGGVHGGGVVVGGHLPVTSLPTSWRIYSDICIFQITFGWQELNHWTRPSILFNLTTLIAGWHMYCILHYSTKSYCEV